MRLAAQHTRLLALALRCMTLLLACELSGVVHAAVDVAAALSEREHAENDCEQEGHECPPGCPGCHCPNNAVAWTAPVFPGLRELRIPRPAAALRPSGTLPPREADTAGLYRPPKLSA
jgi:hypothetical protein